MIRSEGIPLPTPVDSVYEILMIRDHTCYKIEKRTEKRTETLDRFPNPLVFRHKSINLEQGCVWTAFNTVASFP